MPILQRLRQEDGRFENLASHCPRTPDKRGLGLADAAQFEALGLIPSITLPKKCRFWSLAPNPDSTTSWLCLLPGLQNEGQ